MEASKSTGAASDMRKVRAKPHNVDNARIQCPAMFTRSGPMMA